MHFSIQHGKFHVAIEGDVVHTLKKVSEAFPGEEVWVFALNRGRISAIDGEIAEDVSDISRYYDLSDYPELLQQVIVKQWKDLMVGEVTTTLHLRRLSYEEMWPADPTKWATYRHLINRVNEGTTFFIDGVRID